VEQLLGKNDSKKTKKKKGLVPEQLGGGMSATEERSLPAPLGKIGGVPNLSAKPLPGISNKVCLPF
jgi:hypothetical protein